MDFHITISGTADESIVDDLVMKKAKKLAKDLKAGNVELEIAKLNSGHFLGGSIDLVEPVTESTEGADES